MNFLFILTILIPAILSFLFDYLLKHTGFSNISNKKQQYIIGLVFGLSTICLTKLGINYNDAILNVRDGAVLSAGLLFGGPVGIIAGFIGGIEGWLSCYWNGGEVTRLASCISTISCGINAALLRKLIFKDKSPSFSFGIAVTIGAEVLYMLMLLIININDMSKAFDYVSYLALPTICLNCLTVGLSFIAVGKRIIHRMFPRPMIYDFANALFVCVIIMFIITASLTHLVNGAFARSEARELIENNLGDVQNQIHSQGITYSIRHWRVGQTGGLIILDEDLNVISYAKSGMAYPLESLPSADLKTDTFYKTNINGEDLYCELRLIGDYYAFVFIPCDEADVSHNVTLYMVIFVESLIYITIFFFAYQILKIKVADPMYEVNAGLKKICQNNLDTVIDVNTNAEFVNLSSGINQTVNVLKDHIEDARKRIERELELAKHIQKTAVPFIFPPFPKRKDLDIYAHMNTAKEVGGDFYDFYFTDDNHFAFLIADVSGKGIPAAMFMMASKTLIKGLTENGNDVDKVFDETNKKLCANNDAGMFLTAWMGLIDLNTGHLTYVDAGHNPPLLYRKNKGFEFIKTKPSFILAGLETTKYKKYELDLNPGDGIYLYTDGVTEANDNNGNLYGEKRLYEVINKLSEKDTKDICFGIEEDVNKFAEGVEQSDDITMLCFKLNYANAANSITVYPDEEALNIVNDFLSDKLSVINVSKNILNKIQICNDEIYSNIMKYSGATCLEISFALNNESLVLTYKDNGMKFDQSASEDPDVTSSLKDRKIGGLGIFMVKKMCKSLKYEYKDEHNVLLLTFDLG